MTFLRRNWLYALLIALPFERIPSISISISGHPTTVRISYFTALIGFVIFMRQLLGLLRWRPASPQFWLLIYLLVAVISVVFAENKTHGLVALVATIITVGAGLTVSQIVRFDQVAKIYRTLFYVTIVICVIGLYQFLGDSLGLAPKFTGLAANYTHQVFGFPRVQATSLEPLFLGNFLLIPLLLTVAQLLNGHNLRKLLPFLILLSTIITLTLSRGTFYAGIAGIIGLACCFTRKQTLAPFGATIGSIAIGIGIGLGLIAIVTTYGPYHRAAAIKEFEHHSTTITASSTSADSDRVVDRKFAIAAFKKRPVLGYGLGNFGAYVQLTHPGYFGKNTLQTTANDEYLEVLSETGLLGALALLGFATTLLVATAKRLPAASKDERMWLLGLVAIAGGFAIQYYSFSTLYIMHIWVALGLLIGLSQYPSLGSRSSDPLPSRRRVAAN